MGCVQSKSLREELYTQNSLSPLNVNDSGIDSQPKSPGTPNNEIKVLLLGASQSGKSTLLKQMKLAYGGRYRKRERDSYKEIIFGNVTQSMRDILTEMPYLHLQVSPKNNIHNTTILEFTNHFQVQLSQHVVDAIRDLWHDPNVQEAIRRSREFQLNDSALYYFTMIDRIGQPNYSPTNQDILHSRVRTTGISETTFQVGELRYRVHDVGGTRSERKKWVHCFENVTAMLYLVGLSEYDQMLYEDDKVNRMQEALTLFDSICNSRWFTETTIILLLNKIDLFVEKLRHSSLADYFPDYTGGEDYETACNYILHRFVSLNESPTKQIYAHYICATDIQQTKSVLNEVHDTLSQYHLRDCDPL